MAGRSRAADWERWQRAQARELERQRRAEIAAAKAAERQQRERYLIQRKADAERRTHQLEARLQDLESILRSGVSRSARIDLAAQRRKHVPTPFDPGEIRMPTPQPRWVEPKPPGPFVGLFGRGARHEKRVAAARAEYERARLAWEAAESVRQAQLLAAQRDHEARMAADRREVNEFNQRVDFMVARLRARERQAVETYLRHVLSRIPLPSDFPRQVQVTYSPQAEQAVVQMQLPGRDVVPTVRCYKFVQNRDVMQPVARSAKEVADLYRSVVAQVALLVVRDLFDADAALASVAFNGHVDATNPATGRREYPCLISLNVERAVFEQLVLDQVRPEVCLRHLNALVSPHPYELEPITPILDFDLTKYSFVEGLDAVSTLDHRPDLMKMSPTEFEHLVRQVFEAMEGMEGWTTEASNDDGVDGVVVNRRPLVGGLTIVQAKRYKDAVGVSHIRELAGAMEEKKAGRGILVTTSWFTPRSWAKAKEHGRIELIDGNRLCYLIKENLGKDVLIGINRPRTATTGPSSAESDSG